MEINLRTTLYARFLDRKVAFNPVEPEPFDIVDLTIDVTNSTRIYHERTECVREALAGASLVITDNQPLADAVRRVIPYAPVIALPYGPAVTPHIRNETPVVGLLNHDDDYEMNNLFGVDIIKGLSQPVVVYGRALAGVSLEIIEDFDTFCHRCDILFLPSLPGAINSITLPLAAMGSGMAILASPSYYSLDAATGVKLISSTDPDAWQKNLDRISANQNVLRSMQERNAAFSARITLDTWRKVEPLLIRFPAGPSKPLSKDCGCDKKKKKTPPQPISETPVIVETEPPLPAVEEELTDLSIIEKEI